MVSGTEGQQRKGSFVILVMDFINKGLLSAFFSFCLLIVFP